FHICALAHSPHHKSRIEIVSGDEVPCMSKTPVAEGAHDFTGGFPGWRKPVFMPRSVCAASFLDDTLLFQLPQPFDQQRARNQCHAAVDIIEAMGAEQQLAHDEWRPSCRKDFGCLGHRTKLAITACHPGHLHGCHVADGCCLAFKHHCRGRTSSEIELDGCSRRAERTWTS